MWIPTTHFSCLYCHDLEECVFGGMFLISACELWNNVRALVCCCRGWGSVLPSNINDLEAQPHDKMNVIGPRSSICAC